MLGVRARPPASSEHQTLIGVIRLATVRANPHTFGVVDRGVARTAVRAHRKYSSGAAAYLALLRDSFFRDFATLIFLSHTFLIRPRPVELQRISDRVGDRLARGEWKALWESLEKGRLRVRSEGQW